MKLRALALLAIRFFSQAAAVLEPGPEPTPPKLCKSKLGIPCITRSELPWSVYKGMVDGDPCNRLNKAKTEGWCYVHGKGLGRIFPCVCKKGCGCGKDPPIPPPEFRCDNKSVPKTFKVNCNYPYSKDSNLCRYKGLGKPCLNQVCAYGFTDKEKQQMVDIHNKLRRKLAKGNETRGVGGGQPPAADMYKIYWSDELAEVAQRWTDQCRYGHDSGKSRVIRPNFTYVGQNGYKVWAPLNYLNKYHTGGVAVWYNEVRFFNASHVDKFKFRGSYGHFSQVVWSTTKYIGCGFIRFKDYANWYVWHIFCDYAPSGNWVGGKMYQRGEAATKCRKGSVPDDGLCDWKPKHKESAAGDRASFPCKILLGALLILVART